MNREQIAWLEPKRVRAITEWWTRRGWRARLLGRIGYRWELVDPSDICPCSYREFCEGDDCLCEDELFCLDGRFHTPMGYG